MSRVEQPGIGSSKRVIIIEKTFQRFSLGQRWEHLVLLVSFATLLLTGLPQKYRTAVWSQNLLSTPDRLEFIRQVHHIAALVLTAEILYHLCRAVILIAKRRLPGDILPNWQDVKDAFHMLKVSALYRQTKTGVWEI